MRRLSGLLECAKPRPRQYLRGAQGLAAADAVLSAGAHNGQGFEGQGDEHDGSSVRRDGIIVSSLSFTGVPRAHGPIWGAALGEDGCPVAVPLGPPLAVATSEGSHFASGVRANRKKTVEFNGDRHHWRKCMNIVRFD
jgi:hypothetical protein